MRTGRVAAVAVASVLAAVEPSRGVTIDWVTVGDPGNPCSPEPGRLPTIPGGCYGAVDYEYRIARTETTNAQYSEFLNSVARADPNALYEEFMGSPSVHGGIVRTGTAGSYTYASINGRESLPVVFTTFYSAARFANWMHNGQPVGDQGPATTEDGAYTITITGISSNTITRNAGAIVFIPSENEWFKAAYYSPLNGTYFDYPGGSDTPMTCAPPTAAPNSAMCGGITGDLAPVGSYPGSASPYGTLDQGGNANEWNDTIAFGVDRPARGGASSDFPQTLAASFRITSPPTGWGSGTGFRVASIIPEPDTALLVMVGVLAMACRRPAAPAA
jgi:hypothetical protein